MTEKYMKKEEIERELYSLMDQLQSDGHHSAFAMSYEIGLACKRLHQISLRECNGVKGPDGNMKWDDSDQATADRTRKIAQNRVMQALHGALGVSGIKCIQVEFSADPRGAPVVVHTKGKQDRLATFY